jgi:NADH-quinone oxidoreductase subunit M
MIPGAVLLGLPCLGALLAALPRVGARAAHGVAWLHIAAVLTAWGVGATPVDVTWMPALGARLSFGFDRLALAMTLLSAVHVAVALIGVDAPGVRARRAARALVLAQSAALTGVWAAQDLLTFFLAWEATLPAQHALTAGYGGGPERRGAAARVTLTLLAGGLPLLVAAVLLAASGAPLQVPAADAPLGWQTQAMVGGWLAAGLAAKIPVPPLHAWMVRVLPEAPAYVGAWTVGFKLGAFGLFRWLLPLAPDWVASHATAISGLGALGVVWGGMLALAQPGLRRMIAFLSLSHAGLVLFGAASPDPLARQGALGLLLTFPLGASGLAWMAGMLIDRLGTTDRAGLGGLGLSMPRFTTLFLVFSATTLGVPLTASFPAEVALLVGSLGAQPGLGVFALLGLGLGAAALGRFIVDAFTGPARGPAAAQASDLTPREVATLLPLAVLSVLGGLWTGWLPMDGLWVGRGP